ncbi:hypothetical protein WJX84_009059 [Apatococcus fuscideae]|uniref:Transmembrane protein 242 n=1 Tax=Apatococcus fuscideae TaxID=2026836 RepID=A0AAW1SPG4_9CHLO
MLVSLAVTVFSCFGVIAAVSTAAAVSELRRRGLQDSSPAATDVEVSDKFERATHKKSPWARGTAALCLGGALLFFLTEYLQNSLHPFQQPAPRTHTCSQGLSDTKRARFYGDLGGFSHATLTSSPVASKLIEAV